MILGRHTLIELHGCNPAALSDAASLRSLMLTAVQKAGGTYVTDVFHHFAPHGVSGVIVIAESHVTIHTWPEHGYAAVDIFSCSSALDQVKIEVCIRLALRASHVTRRAFHRGPIEP